MRTLIVLSLIATACQTSEDISATSRAISGGGASDRDAVVLIYAEAQNCSGTVVGTRQVLTAKLCLFDGDTPARVSRIQVIVGNVDAPTQTARAAAVYFDESASRMGEANNNDLAIIVTTEDLVSTPLALAETPAVVDDIVTLVGYGQTEFGTSLSRMEGDVAIASVREDVYSTELGPVVACSGDAGGPAIDSSGAVVAVPLYIFGPAGTEVPMCGNAANGMRDVTRYRDDIMAWMAMDPPEADAGVDAGIDDGGPVLDAVVADEAGVDASMGGGGGGCAVGGGPHECSLLLLLALVRSRRR